MKHYEWIAAIIVAIMWGIMPVYAKPILSKIQPVTFIIGVSFAMFLISLLVGLLYYKNVQSDFAKLSIVDTRSIIGLVCGFGLIMILSNLIYYYILHNNDTYLVAAITACYPIITFLLAFLFLNEKITYIRALASLLIVTGIMCFSIDK